MTNSPETLTLSEAVKLTGFSNTKFNNEKNKQALTELGASTEGTGKNWSIPVSALIELEWLNTDGTPLKQATKKDAATYSRRSPLERLESDIAKAEGDIARADDLKKAAQTRLKEARKNLEGLRAELYEEARRKIAEGQAELERLESLTGTSTN